MGLIASTCGGQSVEANGEPSSKDEVSGKVKKLAARLPSVDDAAVEGAEKALSAEEQRLFLRVIDKLEEHDEFVSCQSDSGSEAGDSTGDPIEVDYGDDTELERAHELENPKIEDWELVNAWHQLRHHRLPEKTMSQRILKAVTKQYAAQPNVIQIARPDPGQHLIVVGDLHGHLGDLMHIFDVHGEPREGAGGTIYIFNGDFVDRGIWGPEVLLCLYCLKLRFPNAVHLNRGNHEDCKMNAQQGNGFRDVHCVRAWKGESAFMYRLCRRSFLCLPLVHVIGGEIAVIHGGLPLDPHVKLEDIDKINRKRDVPMPSCACLGYPLRQPVSARKVLWAKNGQRIPAGSNGEIVAKVKKSPSVEVFFEGGYVHAQIWGCPELEQEIEPIYGTTAEKETQRLDRIFISLLWSDPIEAGLDEVPGPNTSRGMGTRFDASTTEDFLKTNNLQCILRSHQKRGDGFELEHKLGDVPRAVTIFSASNYPGGAGEMIGDGNKASVAVFNTDEASVSRPLISVMQPSKAWSEPHSNLEHWSRPELKGAPSSAEIAGASSKARLDCSTPEEKDSQIKAVRAQALEQLWLMIYCYRPELLAFFSGQDEEQKGVVSLTQWASAMRGCLVPDDSFPWEELAPHLATFTTDGMCHYPAFLMRYKNTLSSRLESHWCRRALGQLFSKMGESTEAETQWRQLDRNGDNELSYFELRPLLKAHLTFNASDIEDDGVYTLLSQLDKDCSGYVEKNEFLEAVGSGRQWVESPQGLGKNSSEQENQAIDQCWGFLHGAMRALSLKHTSVSVLFRFFDTSNDGQLTREEFQQGLRALLGESQKALLATFDNWEPLLWTLIDKDGSGSVSQEELHAALYVTDSVANR